MACSPRRPAWRLQGHQGQRRRLELEQHHAGHRLRQPEHARLLIAHHGHAGPASRRSSTRSSSGTRTTAGASRRQTTSTTRRCTARRSTSIRHGSSRSRTTRIRRSSRGSASRSTSGRMRRDSRPPAAIGRAWRGISSRADEPLPRLNLSGRFYFNDDLSMTSGRHNFKIGVSLEYNRKTEPGSADYMGNFNFGHDANNPLSTGNGYANMLLGVFTTYTELTSRVDRDVRHWQNDFYVAGQLAHDAEPDHRPGPARAAQRIGLRSQQHEQRVLHRLVAARRRGPRLPVGLHERRARQPGLRRRRTSGRSIRPTRASSSRPRSTATSCRARASRSTGSSPAAWTGRKDGTYFTFPYFVWAPRAGIAWNVTGDGKTALRASWGIFYNFPRSTGDGGYPFSGGCPVSCTRVRSAGRASTTSPPATPSEPDREPVNVTAGGYEQPLAKSHNVNVAFQRDIGFNTVAEIAWVGNYTENHGRLSMTTGCRCTCTATRRTW